MGTIYVKNGNWDEACAKLKVELDNRDAQFNAKVGATFASGKKQPGAQEAAAPAKSSSPFSLSSRTSTLPDSRVRR